MTPQILLAATVAGLAAVCSQDIAQEHKSEDIAPPALTTRGGDRVASPDAWWKERRPEIAKLFAELVYGRMPKPPERPRFEIVARHEALAGLATMKQVAIRLDGAADGPILHLLVFVPKQAKARVPAFVGLNFYGNHTVANESSIPLSTAWIPARGKGVVGNRATDASRGSAASRWALRQTLEAGYAVATAYHGDIDPDFDDGWKNGIHPRFYRDDQKRPADDEWGTIAAWAFGLHRALDYLVTDPDIDPKRVCVMGHSRNGKTALLAGATDARFALVISNQSGCGGAALSRRRKGETVKRINTSFPHWFDANFKRFNDRESELPVDQHLLIAMCAPRPVLVCSAAKDLWADPEGEFVALVGADPVYRLLGTDGLATHRMPGVNELVASTLGYHIRPGKHAIGAADWAVFVEFANARWKASRGDRR